MTASMADALVALAREQLDLFHDPANEAWAWDGVDALRIGSAAFAERLARDSYLAMTRVPSPATVTSASTTLRGDCQVGGSRGHSGPADRHP